MTFNNHSRIEGMHAFLSASKYHWVNYDEDKLYNTYMKHLASKVGTRLHAFACESIKLGIKLPKTKKTLNLYINDAIGFQMTPEQTLYYSENCFGTADAISFRQNTLRIHDLKTGETLSSPRQLEIYASLFCLEYDVKPQDIEVELRIYQCDEVKIYKPLVEDLLYITEKIITFDKQIDKMKLGV